MDETRPAVTDVHLLEDDVKMDMGIIGEYVEYPMAALRRQDALEQAWFERAPWEPRGQYPRERDSQRY